jgi:hypothetical protein
MKTLTLAMTALIISFSSILVVRPCLADPMDEISAPSTTQGGSIPISQNQGEGRGVNNVAAQAALGATGAPAANPNHQFFGALAAPPAPNGPIGNAAGGAAGAANHPGGNMVALPEQNQHGQITNSQNQNGGPNDNNIPSNITFAPPAKLSDQNAQVSGNQNSIGGPNNIPNNSTIVSGAFAPIQPIGPNIGANAGSGVAPAPNRLAEEVDQGVDRTRPKPPRD